MSAPDEDPNTTPPTDPADSGEPPADDADATKDETQKDQKKAKAKTKRRPLRGSSKTHQIPQVTPSARCQLRLLKLKRIYDWLNMEDEFISNCEKIQATDSARQDKLAALDVLRGSPVSIVTFEELINDDHAIIRSHSLLFYVWIPSFVDRLSLTPGISVLSRASPNDQTRAIIGVLEDDPDALVDAMKVDMAPTETYGDVGGLDSEINEIKEAVELPLTHPELYTEIGIRPPKGVILFGPPGTGKTLLAKAVAHETSATFLRVVGSELIKKYLGEGPKLVRDLFRNARESTPAIVFIDEIDAIGAKRHETSSSGAREVQRTMLELLTQLDGFDDRGDIKVILATNRIEALDPALIRPGRIDRKIELRLPDEKARLKIFEIHTAHMALTKDVSLWEMAAQKEELSGADIKAICTEAGTLAMRDGRVVVGREDFIKGREKVLYRKKENIPAGMFI
jgi:26S proteasome regulatory subunit T2